ncbi:MAG: hypothetical protein EA353_13740 [Puniceicoccaceae bacterium]|nr:MAG: hypothetical protein EA353_13740 [Puniceicoccaceae bacterium]
MKHRQTGSSLFVVVIVAAALGVGVYSMLSLVQNEFRLTRQAAVYHEARLAAESILEQSMADLSRRLTGETAFPNDSLKPGNNPLRIGNEFIARYSGEGSPSGLIIPDKTVYTSVNDFGTELTEVIGGLVTEPQWRYIDPRDIANAGDPFAGTRVLERNIEVLAKATVERPLLGRQTVHVRQVLLVRDAPLFAYAIFYNLPLEIAPGARMDIYGNIHGNNNGYLQSNNGLNMHSRLTLGGDLFHGRRPGSGMGLSTGAVNILNSSGKLVNMKKDGSWPKTDATDAFTAGNWLQSSSNNFADLANQIWSRNVQTAVHGVLPQNPVGVTEYIEDTNPNTSAKESFNSAYQIIQPPLRSSDLSIPDATSDPVGHQKAVALNEIEKQKYSYKAGLIINVAADGTLSYLTPQRNSAGDLIYGGDGLPLMDTLNPSQPITESTPFSETPVLDPESGEIISYEITGGFHDKRQAQDLNIVNVNVDKLTELIHGNNESDWGGSKPEDWWNGVVYVQFPQQNSSPRADGVNPAISGWGVRVRNAQTIPNPEFAIERGESGMSLATNQMMYIEGHYNADGNRNTGSPLQPDDPSNFGKEGYEAPAALIADSITFLSPNWDDRNSNQSLSTRSPTHTEVSAAILTGLVPSGKTGSNSYSGGLENFPRFLESWGGEMRIRGSMVALFESEVGTARWGKSDVYSAPTRSWGFHEAFADGAQPPGTPNTRRFLATDFTVLNQTEYAARIKQASEAF